jgi:hypothetical protein
MRLPRETNYADRGAVIDLADHFNSPNLAVFQDAGLRTYGLTHITRPDMMSKPGRRIVYRTDWPAPVRKLVRALS